MDKTISDDAVRHHAEEVRASALAKQQSNWLDLIKTAVCIILIIGAAYTEVVSVTIAIDAAFPKMSDGSSPADAIMGLRYTLAFYALLGHVLISSITGRVGIGVRWLLAVVAIIALFTMLLGTGLFSFAGTALTVGGDSEASGLFGLLSGMATPALGAICGSTFITSFAAAHYLAGKLLTKLNVISSAYDERERFANLDREIKAVNSTAAQIETERREIAEMELPGALVRKVAAEMSRIVGNVAAQAHEAVMTRKAFEGVDLTDSDEVPAHLRDIPLPLLEQMLADLKQYTPAYFTTLLTKED